MKPLQWQVERPERTDERAGIKYLTDNNKQINNQKQERKWNYLIL